jgi:DNA-damage-inducible protein J
MSATITIRIDEKLKRQSEQVFEDMGLSMTAAFTIFAKPSDPFHSEANQERLRKSIAALNAGKGKAHELIEA